MTKNNEMYTAWGERIKRNGTLLNIDFKTKDDAKLCCKLLNQQDNDISYYINHLDEIFKWHKEHYGKSILDERLEFKSDCEKENELLKKENQELKEILQEVEHELISITGLSAFDKCASQLGYVEVFDEDRIELDYSKLLKKIEWVTKND